ncbi:MAG TPA: hypothetical protein VM735_00270 [Candidatus Kapabacteria bacterium]|jgi:hypothetical protein|nr:hypothetical protein [Candidatus Kapabacteria bacterium]
MSDLDIDSAIISAVGQDWTKAALAVWKTGQLLGVKSATVAARMTELIEQGILAWDGGDLSEGRSWVNGRVRKSN